MSLPGTDAPTAPAVRLPRPVAPRGLVMPLVAVLTAVLGAGLAVAGPRALLLLVLIPVQALLAVCWLALAAVPARLAGGAVATAAAVLGDVVLATEQHPGLGALAGVVGLGVVAAVLGQLLRQDRSRVTDVLAAQTSAVLLAVAVAPLVSLPAYARGDRAVAVALATLGLCVLTAEAGGRLLPVGTATGRLLAALVLGGGAGAGLGAAVLGGTGAAVGAAAAALTVAADVVVGAVAGGRRIARPLGALLPFALVAPGVYVLGRLMLG